MLKIKLFVVILFLSFNSSAETRNPFKLKVGSIKVMGYPRGYYDFYSLKDSLIIKKIILNNGHCKLKVKYPIRLLYGQKYTIYDTSCPSGMLEMTIETAYNGSWTWN
jgi:hypothetical protein